MCSHDTPSASPPNPLVKGVGAGVQDSVGCRGRGGGMKSLVSHIPGNCGDGAHTWDPSSVATNEQGP